MLGRLRQVWAQYNLGKLTGDLKGGTLSLLQFACLVRCFREYGVDLTLCVGPSMLPTFNERGDLVLLEHYSVSSQQIRPGDVVIAKSAQTPRHIVCKRVLGLEGDTVPKGHVWLQGDNWVNSTDSRSYGPVPYALLQGRVFLKIWPPGGAGWVKSELPAYARP